jgi:aminocarboxymuconate-semialdehyde decarboxylase
VTPLADGPVDVHTHSVPYAAQALRRPGDPAGPWLRVDSPDDAVIMLDNQEFRRVGADAWDADARLAVMDEDGIAVQVVSPTPVFFCYRIPADAAAAVAEAANDAMLELCAAAPERLVPFCQVPLQDGDAACAELERAVAAGHRGVEIGNHVADRDLDDAAVVTFLQHAAALDVPVFVHPWDLPTGPRLERWMAQWLAGMPADTHLSILALLLGGVFDRVDARLRICFAHGGGSFAFWLGRLDNAWRRRSDVVRGCAQPPSSYVKRFYVDAVVLDPRSLRLLVDVLGVSQVLLGSDFPYPLGERPVGGIVRTADFLTDDERFSILSGNARRYLGGPQ